MEPIDTQDKNNNETSQRSDEIAQPAMWLRLEKECQAMALHAFAKGLSVPVSVMKAVAEETQVDKTEKSVIRRTTIHNRLS